MAPRTGNDGFSAGRLRDGEPAERGRASLRPLATIWPFLARYKGLIAGAAISLLVAAGATLAIPLAVRRIIDFGFSRVNEAFIDQYFGTMMAVALVLAVASAARFYFVTTLGERVVNDLRKAVFERVLRLSAGFFDVSQSGEITSRLTADTTQIKAAVGASASIALRNLVLLIGAVAMMIVTSPRLSGMVLLAIPLIVVPLIVFGRKVRARSRFAQDTLADAAALAGERISGVRTVQAFNNEVPVAGQFAGAIETAYAAARASIQARALLTAGVILLVFSSVVGVLWYGAQDVLAGNLTGGALGQFVLYSVFAAGAMGELSQVWGEVQQAAGAAERLSELLNARSPVTERKDPLLLPEPARGEIAFDKVSFRYPVRADDRVLHDIALHVKPGETVAIVGPSGAGKSTLFHLLMRAYDPNEGRILLDGTDIAAVRLTDLRARIALVPQDPIIFAASVADNIRFGRLDASMADVRAAAAAANADSFIEALPEGYETQVGERGVTLSGGQRQRLAIARAILRDAPVLLLDEATSALDAESETAVQAAIARLKQGRTTLVIAHRLATVREADRIVVMEAGRIVEEGTHDSLRGDSGLYARLAELQFGEATSPAAE